MILSVENVSLIYCYYFLFVSLLAFYLFVINFIESHIYEFLVIGPLFYYPFHSAFPFILWCMPLTGPVLTYLFLFITLFFSVRIKVYQDNRTHSSFFSAFPFILLCMPLNWTCFDLFISFYYLFLLGFSFHPLMRAA